MAIDPRKIDELSGPLKGYVRELSPADQQNWRHSGPHGMHPIEMLETQRRISDGGVKGRWSSKEVSAPAPSLDIPVDQPERYFTFFFEDSSDLMLFDTWWKKKESK